MVPRVGQVFQEVFEDAFNIASVAGNKQIKPVLSGNLLKPPTGERQ
jgi:hypothetical protein